MEQHHLEALRFFRDDLNNTNSPSQVEMLDAKNQSQPAKAFIGAHGRGFTPRSSPQVGAS